MKSHSAQIPARCRRDFVAAVYASRSTTSTSTVCSNRGTADGECVSVQTTNRSHSGKINTICLQAPSTLLLTTCVISVDNGGDCQRAATVQ